MVKSFLGRWGLYVILLPVFFVLHAYIQYHGLVTAGDAIKILAKTGCVVLVFFVILLALKLSVDRSSQLTGFTTAVILFYGVLKDFVGNLLHLPLLASYSVLLPLLFIISIFIYRRILRSKQFFKTNLFVNVLLLIYLLVDISILLFTNSTVFKNQNQMVKKQRLNIQAVPQPAQRPDVYYLVFDCYPGSRFLTDYMHYNNGSLDTALRKNGFRVIDNSISNYNRTAYSIASSLNFEYLENINSNTQVKPIHYNNAKAAVRYAVVPALFKQLGYKIYNLSIFQLEDQPPMWEEQFLTLPGQEVLLSNTLPGRMKTDILWKLNHFAPIHYLLTHFYADPHTAGASQQLAIRNFNNRLIDSIPHIARDNATVPRFIYAHFHLPHPPFFYNEAGEANNLDSIPDKELFIGKKFFIPYLRYSNRIMLGMIDSILQRAVSPPVIIIQSDHGFTDFDECPPLPKLAFKNFTAYYFPDKDYSMLYDSMSNINTFPVIFDKYFFTHIPLQKDSSLFIQF